MSDKLDALDVMGTVTGPAHSPLGASGAERWLNCPGSYRESIKAPYRRASIHAATGTVAHEFIETALSQLTELHKQGLWSPGEVGPPVLSVEPGQTRVIDGHTVTADDNMLTGIDVMLDYVLSRWREDVEVSVERRVTLDPYWTDPKDQPPVPMFGRSDVWLRNLFTRSLEMIDYKNGAGVVVSPVNNNQLLYYAAGALALPENSTIEHVTLTVVQPNARSQTKVTSWETSALDIRMWVDEVIKPGVRAVMAPDAPLVMGRWCRFCPALSQCPAHIEAARETAQVDFAEPGVIFSPAEMGRLLDLAEAATRWADAIRERAQEDLKAEGAVIPGWQLVPTRPVRDWDGKKLADWFAHNKRHPGAFQRTTWASPAQMEKKLSPQAWAEVSPFVVSKSSGTKLARSDAADDFDNLQQGA